MFRWFTTTNFKAANRIFFVPRLTPSLLSKALLTCTKFGAGDVICQLLQQNSFELSQINAVRSVRMMCYGFFIGPCMRFVNAFFMYKFNLYMLNNIVSQFKNVFLVLVLIGFNQLVLITIFKHYFHCVDFGLSSRFSIFGT